MKVRRKHKPAIAVSIFSQPLRDIIHPEDLAENDTLLKTLLAGEVRHFQVEKRHIRIRDLDGLNRLHGAQMH